MLRARGNWIFDIATFAMRVSHGNAAAGPMATRESITTVGQGARGAP